MFLFLFFFSNGSYFEWKAALLILKVDLSKIICAQLGLIWLSGFQIEDFDVIF